MPLLNPATPEALARYRSRHVIVVRGDRCGNCGLRVLERRSGARPLLYRHDPDEVRRLAAAERGEAPPW